MKRVFVKPISFFPEAPSQLFLLLIEDSQDNQWINPRAPIIRFFFIRSLLMLFLAPIPKMPTQFRLQAQRHPKWVEQRDGLEPSDISCSKRAE